MTSFRYQGPGYLRMSVLCCFDSEPGDARGIVSTELCTAHWCNAIFIDESECVSRFRCSFASTSDNQAIII